MTFDEIKKKPGTYVSDDGETMAVVFIGEEIFGVNATNYNGLNLFTLDRAECINDVWSKSPDQLKLSFAYAVVNR